MSRFCRPLAVAGWCCAALTGCAGFWDEVTSRDFDVRTAISPPEPMTVLRTSTDGDARAKAMRRLKEPRLTGGTEQEQEEVVQLLRETAMSDPQPICRMAAISALGRFQDPRAVQALAGAYQTADQLSPEVAYHARCQALRAMGETKNPQAVEFLTEIARQPADRDATDRERGQGRDVRLTAVRALGNFRGSTKAGEALGQLAQADRDVAIRDRAKESYVAVAGKEPPAPSDAPPASEIQNVGHVQPAGH